MQYLFIFISVVIFVALWITIINRFLPSGVISSGNRERRYDERQAKIFTEVLARTCVWLVYSLLWNLMMKLLGFVETPQAFPSAYNEVMYLIIALIWAIISYFIVQKKYTPKSDNYEE